MTSMRSCLRSSVAVTAILIVALAPTRATARQQSIPTPESSFGFKVGADFKLATYEQSLTYFRALDEASSALTLVKVGKTSEGRDWFFSLISSPENLENIDRYREIVQRLAHPAGLTDETAKQLAGEGKAFVHIDGGLHASEVAGAQHTIQLAYDLANGEASNDPEITEILDNVVVLLWPSLNPDGQTIVADWYMDNVGSPYEIAPLPVLYQKYIGHDNNRDAYMLNMIESRVIERTWRDWEPHIKYVHHQTAPFPTRIWLPPFAEPIATQSPPLIAREINMIGMAIAQKLETGGQPGATHMGTGFDSWYPGYIDYMPVLQNIAAFFTETALYRYATPHFYTVNDFPPSKRDLRAETLYPSPWKGGWWRLRDAVDYMHTASMAVLEYASKYRETLLFNRYQSGRNTIQRYEQEPPFAYFVPQDQRDPVAPVEMLRRLAFNGVKISQLTSSVTVEGISYPTGTWVIPMNQEFAEIARQVLGVQAYPDLREFPDGPPEQPYDAAGWTLQYQFGVRVTAAMQPLEQSVLDSLVPIAGDGESWEADLPGEGSSFDSVPGIGFNTNAVAAGIVPRAGRITGSGSVVLVDPAQNNAFRAINRALQLGGTVTFVPDGKSGRYAIDGVSSSAISEWVEDLALQAERSRSGGTTIVRTRIGLYRPWNASMDEGWTRWLLELYDFDFSNITAGEMQSGALGERFDVILLASDSPRSLIEGYSKGSVPPRYEGGIGSLGVRNLDQFVRGGGTLVCMNSSCGLAIDELKVPVKNVVEELKSKDFFTGGSILEVSVDTSHPVMAGMPSSADIFVSRSPVYTTLEGFKGTALASYSKTGSPLRSGYMLGEEHLQGYAAALDVLHGDGHVVMIGFRPQWRGQSFGTFRVLFNALLYGGELAKGEYGNADFWTAPEEAEEKAEEEKERKE